MSILQSVFCGSPPADPQTVCKSSEESGALDCPAYWRETYYGMGPGLKPDFCQGAVVNYEGSYLPPYQAQEDAVAKASANQTFLLVMAAAVAALLVFGGGFGFGRGR